MYIRKEQNTVAQYISTRLFLDLCGATERTPRGAGGDALAEAGWHRPGRGNGYDGGRRGLDGRVTEGKRKEDSMAGSPVDNTT